MQVTAENISARYRRASIVLVPLTICAAVWFARYPSGGGRLDQVGFGAAAPVTVGEEFHVTVPLETGGGTVELVHVRPVGVTGPVIVDVHLAHRSGQGGGFSTVRGPLTPSDNVVLMPTSAEPGLKITNMGGEFYYYGLDVVLVATGPGYVHLDGVEVTYRAGFLRQRTARFQTEVCLRASADWKADRTDVRSTCKGRT